MSGQSLTFYSLFNRVGRVEIPILQRDYAQGRPEQDEVRSLFLSSLFNALTQADGTAWQPLDLDFVYGNYESSGASNELQSKVFSVLDGQQRLTTLFLLHWYLALVDCRSEAFRKQFVSPDGQSRFTYKTRPGANEFFNALVLSDLTIGDAPISKAISDCQWFYLSWKQDPTVQACLYMLDSIQRKFSGNEAHLFERLADINNPCITFQFLELRSFGLSDELYIKMNARGKPLTFFENFKAKLEQYISNYSDPWPTYYLSNDKRVVSGFEYFNHKIDTDWADLFWPYRNTCSKDDTFDQEFMNFFRFIILLQSLLESRENSRKLTNLTQTFFGGSGRLTNPSLSKYDELDCFSQELIVRFIQIMDLLCANGTENNKIRPYLDAEVYFSEQRVFERILNNTANYDDKLRFFAFYSYLAKKSDLSEIKDWMRVIYNLTENTVTDSAIDFYRALFVIDDLCQLEQPILQSLKADCDLSVFLSAQILEEKIKAHLILKSDEWRQAILKAESHTFFNGQIGSLLNFSGVLAYYREFDHCNWGDAENESYFNQFNRYFEDLAVVFDRIRWGSASIGYAWERAVLSKGVYCTSASQSRLNLLHSQDTRNNIQRDHSWRRRLRIGNHSEEAKQSFVKEVLDDVLFDRKRLKESLDEICSHALSNETLGGWRREFIKHKELFDYCSQGFIVDDYSNTVLLSQSQRNHYHCDLNSKVLELELNSVKAHLQPFVEVELKDIRSREDSSEVHLKSGIFDSQQYRIVVTKNGINHSIKFKIEKEKANSDRLISVLEGQGMKRTEGIAGFGAYYRSEQRDIEQAKNQILTLCSKLQELSA